MKHPLLLAAALSLATLSAPALRAADPAPKTGSTSAIDSRALGLLKRMSDTLAAAHSFTYHSSSILEVPASTGQLLTVVSTSEVALARPDKLRARLGGEAPRFDFYYDGSTVSAYAPENGVYSQSKAPATIDAMLSGLRRETGIRFATAPLLFSDPYAILTRTLTSGIIVGQAEVKGVDCTHLAFRSQGVDWEVWLANDARALPHRLAVTFTDEPGSPRTFVEFTRWRLDPWEGLGSFKFRPPAGAREIPFLSVLKATDRR